MNSKNLIIAIIVIVVIAVAGFFITQMPATDTIVNDSPTDETPIPVEPDEGIGDGAAPEGEEPTAERGDETIIGTSVDGKPLTAYHFGDGATEILLIAGVHGGYSWNTALLGYEIVDYLDANPSIVPETVTVTVIPVMNPDGLQNTVGTAGRFSPATARSLSESVRIAGRFNADDVDLNRNFDCEWAETSSWQNRTVSGGDAPFSTPEATAVRDYITTHVPTAAIVWFSAEGKVYPSACGDTPSQESTTLAQTFATAAKYPTAQKFKAYTINGDMVDWMAKQDIPAISVLLSDHTNTELEKNKAGIEAVIKAYAN